MAAAAADAFERGGVLIAEAGTGTGKTLAYLVPAILSRRRVLVSTGTKNLQEQIFFKDIPVLRKALGVPFTATYMKGRANYLCRHRFDMFKSDSSIGAPAERVFLPILERWAARTETGDRAELEELPEDLSFWSDISASSEQCLGSECPQYQECFVTRMRQAATECDIVVVNHHLLCADAAVRQSAFGEVIPACGSMVLDEAHQLEDVVTQYFGLSVSNYRLDELVRDGLRLVSTQPPTGSRRRGGWRAHTEPPVDDTGGRVKAALDHVCLEAQAFFAALMEFRDTAQGGSPRAQASDDRVRLQPSALKPYSAHADRVLLALDGLETSIVLVKDAPEDALAVARRAHELADELRFLMAASDPGYVYFLEARGRGLFLRAAPIDVSDIVRDVLLKQKHGVVLTSATLSVNGSFDYFKSRLGLHDAVELRFASEFDYERQAILYLPRRMPDPRSPMFPEAAIREIVEILRRTSGRAFVLFTSYAMLRTSAGHLSAVLPYPIFVQGEAPRSTLLGQFRSTPNAVLLATASFWQGVDVAGEALSCVIVDKLPFVSPADPITAARIDAIQARGGSPFQEYQLPVAILSLQQGLGRLIRHRQDRGVLAVLDPRLRTKAYGRQFLDSLPPAPVTMELSAVERFFEAETQ
ncbi:MAG: ATP-dependent DNA helicase [Acidobacteria bacterium]|nr:ATP-dependent DNA helicase [Acidobacteriota bacterium]